MWYFACSHFDSKALFLSTITSAIEESRGKPQRHGAQRPDKCISNGEHAQHVRHGPAPPGGGDGPGQGGQDVHP